MLVQQTNQFLLDPEFRTWSRGHSEIRTRSHTLYSHHTAPFEGVWYFRFWCGQALLRSGTSCWRISEPCPLPSVWVTGGCGVQRNQSLRVATPRHHPWFPVWRRVLRALEKREGRSRCVEKISQRSLRIYPNATPCSFEWWRWFSWRHRTIQNSRGRSEERV